MENWRQVESIYHEAIRLPLDRREEYLVQACGSDSGLRREVDSLLVHEGQADGLLEVPVWCHMPPGKDSATPVLTPGSEIGPYRIVGLVGAGGMGQVYRATDPRLGRDVAIKLLPDSLAADPNRLARFRREARLLAGLNHPHIAAIYDVNDRAIVMELVDGDEVRAPVPPEKAVAVARQIAEALEFAHERGVIHRDLKPANIRFTSRGAVKVLDFGLAKALRPDSAGGDPSESPTITQGSSTAGIILGTAAYMAPEQARGKPVDHRADIWAFGCVFYELLTGSRAFAGETVSDCLSAVISREPDWHRLPDRTPHSVRRILRRCLAKDMRERLHSMADVRILLAEEGPPEPARARARRGGLLAWLVAAAATAAAVCVAVTGFRATPGSSRATNFNILTPENGLVSAISGLTLSPDGRSLAFLAGTRSKFRLWVRDMDSLTSHVIPRTQNQAYPFWSPDGRHVAFFSGGFLRRADIAAGSVITVCPGGNESAALGGSWSPSGVILFSQGKGGLMQVPAAGGTPTPATTLDTSADELVHILPRFLPDGHRFLYVSHTNSANSQASIYLGDLRSKERRKILTADSHAEYAAPGYLLFVRDRALMAQPFDAGSARVTGDPVTVVDQVDFHPGSIGAFSASSNGALAYSSGGVTLQAQLTWFDRSGKPVGTLGRRGVITIPVLSPDGRTVAAQRAEPQDKTRQIWLHDVTRNSMTRMLTQSTGGSRFAVWSPDSASIAYMDDAGKILRHSVTGDGEDGPIATPPERMRPLSWSPDGRFLLLETAGDKGNLWVQPLFGDRKPYQFLRSDFHETNARFSPDGRWVAYASNHSKGFDVYVTSFPIAGAKIEVSTDGGNYPFWARDGKEIFYISGKAELMAAQIKPGIRFDASVPKPLFIIPADHFTTDVSRAGKFLMAADLETSPHPLTVVLNWTALLQKAGGKP